jgi:hypothetical protein
MGPSYPKQKERKRKKRIEKKNRSKNFESLDIGPMRENNTIVGCEKPPSSTIKAIFSRAFWVFVSLYRKDHQVESPHMAPPPPQSPPLELELQIFRVQGLGFTIMRIDQIDRV